MHKTGPKPKPLLDRLADKFTVGDDCWEWTGSKNRFGYGQLAMRPGPPRQAHRLVYEVMEGPIPSGMELDHLCRNPSCVRPDHLEPVTHATNMARSIRVGARKTHCPKGHPYAGDNLYRLPSGGSVCRICARASSRRYKTRKRYA